MMAEAATNFGSCCEELKEALEGGDFEPLITVGADQVKSCSARIVLATNVNLQERIKDGRFRRDLYYRLCSHQIHIPALRERREDIPLLLDTFIEEAALRFDRAPPRPTRRRSPR